MRPTESMSIPSPPSRFSQMVQDKPLRTSWQRKMKERQERKVAKAFARHLEEEKERRRQVRGRPSRLRLEFGLSQSLLSQAWREGDARTGAQGESDLAKSLSHA